MIRIRKLKEKKSYPLEIRFDYFNRTYFENVLSDYTLVWNSRVTRRGGGLYSDEKKIELSAYLDTVVKSQYIEEVYDFILVHEMVHAYIYEVYDKVKRVHGKEFRDVISPIISKEGLSHLIQGNKYTVIQIPNEYYTQEFIDKERQKQQRKSNKSMIG